MSAPTPSPDFTRITRIAAALFDVPLAVLVPAALPGVAGVPSVHTACPGLDGAELARLLAACPADAASAISATVSGIGFHAVPLARPDGRLLGSLCLLDSAPRVFDAGAQALLADLAALAADLAADLAGKLPADQIPHPVPAHAGERPLYALLDELEDGVILLDEEHRVLWANRRAAALVASDAAALPGRRAQDFVVDAIAGLADAAAPGAMLTREMTGRRPDGSTVSLEVRACVLAQDGPRRYAAIVREAAQQQDLAWRARAATERRHKTFSLASHELRTPLASIIGFTELLLKREFDAATARELLEIVHTQAGLMSTLVNGVLDLARIEAGGRQALRIAPAAIDSVLIQALASLDALGQNGRVHLRLAADLPPVAGDLHRLQTAFANVLSNSIRYSGADSPVTVSAALDAAPGAPGLLVRVSDSGVGMQADTCERLFEPFYRGPAPAAGTTGAGLPAGTGLGMAIVKEIVDAHGGSTEVASRPGAGTVVSVRLPLAGAGMVQT